MVGGSADDRGQEAPSRSPSQSPDVPVGTARCVVAGKLGGRAGGTRRPSCPIWSNTIPVGVGGTPDSNARARQCSASSVDRNSVAVATGGCHGGAVTDLQTARLVLHPVDVTEAERIVAGHQGPDDLWAEDFPFDGDVLGVTMFLRATAAHGDQRPFGHYVITRIADGQVIGGVGFKGRPENGSVEIGYGLAPSARGHGCAAEAARALVALAREHRLTRVTADTDTGNTASQRTLEHAGFTQLGTDGNLHLYEIVLRPGHTREQCQSLEARTSGDQVSRRTTPDRTG